MNHLPLNCIGNALLRGLCDVERAHLLPGLIQVPLREGQVLAHADDAIRHIYFPISAVVSLVSLDADGSTLEVAGVGREGIVGLGAIAGDGRTPYCCIVSSPGDSWRIDAAGFRAAYARMPELQVAIVYYMHRLMTQIGQTAACVCHTTLIAQLCRWILLALDRSGRTELSVTQQTIADMLGVRREGVTAAIGKLRDSRLIDHGRCRITVLDRAGLEAISGGAYRNGFAGANAM